MALQHGLNRGSIGQTARFAAATLLLVLAAGGSALAQNGTVTGTVTNQVGGAPLSGVTVYACSPNGGCTTTVTSGAGFYSISRPPGPTYLFTQASADAFVNELYHDMPCLFSCLGEAMRGSTVVVLSNFTASQRNFALSPAGRISGRLSDTATATPLAGLVVRAYRANGSEFQTAASTTTDLAGTYTLTGLAAGRYFVATFNTAGYVDEFFGDVPCPAACHLLPATTGGTPIDVAVGASVGGRDIALSLGGTISGRVTNRFTGAPIQYPSVSIYTHVDGVAVLAGHAPTDASGAYTIGGLAPGLYGAAVYGQFIGWVDEIYDNIRCLGGCQPETVMGSGHTIAVASGAARTGIDFALERTGGMNGRVTDAISGLPMQQVLVKFYRREGSRITYEAGTFTFADGKYYWPALPPGAYYVFADSGVAISETYPNVPCPRPCAGPDVVRGAPIVVEPDVQLTGIDFQLDRGGQVSGTVAEAGGPLQNINVRIYRQAGSRVELVHELRTGPTFEQFGGTGTYTIGGLEPGTYYLLAVDRRANAVYVDELFGGQLCPGCTGTEILAGAPVTLTAGAVATGRNFVLDVGQNFSGTVLDATGTQPIPGVTVHAYSTSLPSRPVGSAISRADGRYVITGLNGGPHVFSSAGPSHYLHEVFNNAPCPGGICSGATSIALGAVLSQPLGYSAFNINFTLAARTDPPGAPSGLAAVAQGFTVKLAWTPSAEGTAATSYVLEAGGAPGTTAVSLPVGTTSLTVPGVAPGVYFLRVRGVNAYGVGPPSSEVTLIVLANGATAPAPPQGLEAWTIGSRLTMTWTDSSAGPTPTSYLVEAGTASGASNVAIVGVTSRNFVFETVPPGFYFLRVRSLFAGLISAPTAETMIVVGGVPSPPGAPQGLSASVAGATVSFVWSAPVVGTPSSYVLEAGSGPGLANLAVFDTGSTATSFAVGAVPPGAYYVRLRARNAQGLSVVSTERVVTVP